MRKDIADMWVKALRSGEYKQTTETLQDDGGYCCLGVLCRVGEKGDVTTDSEDDMLGGDTLEDQPDILEWSGMNSSEGKFGASDTLAVLNDEGSYDFDQLADVIEKEWEQL